MKLAELLPALCELPRAEKFRAVQFLTADLAHEEATALSAGITRSGRRTMPWTRPARFMQYLRDETESR